MKKLIITDEQNISDSIWRQMVKHVTGFLNSWQIEYELIDDDD